MLEVVCWTLQPGLKSSLNSILSTPQVPRKRKTQECKVNSPHVFDCQTMILISVIKER